MLVRTARHDLSANVCLQMECICCTELGTFSDETDLLGHELLSRFGSNADIMEFYKLGQLLRRQHHFKVELFGRLHVLRLWHVSHVVRNRQSVF